MQIRWDSVLLRFLPLWLVLLLLVIAGAYAPFSEAGAASPVAMFTHGAVSVAIPYHGARPGSGRLSFEIVDPEELVLGRVERTAEIVKGDGMWHQSIVPAKPIAFEDLVWQRVRYRFEYGDKDIPAIAGVESISRILRRPVVRMIGQTEYLAGSDAAIRVLVSDAGNEDTALSGTVRAELLIPQQPARPLFSGRLNQRGTVAAQFHFPAGLEGKYDIRLIADTPIGSAEYTQPIELKYPLFVMPTTEKPVYQPGQTIHIRALALDRASHRADADRNLTFEVEDSRGNKVFKKSTATDHFGIAAAEFSLADEVNLGTYHLRALVGDSSAPSNMAEVALNVERYVLPKFKVAVELADPENGKRQKRGYQPGDHVTGTVRATYFFGKPVDNAELSIKASAMDVSMFEVASAHGKTDSDGSYHFDVRLPKYFAGRPLSHGAARVLIEATVKDSAGHSETRGQPITVSDSPLLITVIPEGGTLVPNLENEVFILTSYPNGTPAKADVIVHPVGYAEQRLATDDGGVGIARLKINRLMPVTCCDTLEIDATDQEGNHASSKVELQARDGEDQILLRTEQAVYRAGEHIQLKVFSTKARGAAYIDIVKEGQTVLTRDLDLENGQADL